MVIRKRIDNTFDTRPIIDVQLNGIVMRALIDTGAESIVWTGDHKIIKGLCDYTGAECTIKGIEGNSSIYPVHHGILLFYNDDLNDGRDPIVFNRAEIARTDYKSKNFDFIIPYSLFMDFDITISGERESKEFIIDTKRDNKFFYIPRYNKDLIIYDILAQTSDDNNKFSSLSSLLH